VKIINKTYKINKNLTTKTIQSETSKKG